MIELNNCEVHDNTFVENAVMNAVGTVIVEQGQEGSKDSRFQGFKEEQSETLKPSAKRGRKPKTPRIVTDTYTYQWLNHREGQLRLVMLYQLLIDERFKMLSPDVSPEDWCALFKGEARAFTMKWTGKQAHLRYLFKLMIQRKYITFNESSAKQWEILGCHFVSSSGRAFKDWDKQKDPVRGAKTLQMFADVLNIATTPPDIHSLQDDMELEVFMDEG